jgi:hypothetical protein
MCHNLQLSRCAWFLHSMTYCSAYITKWIEILVIPLTVYSSLVAKWTVTKVNAVFNGSCDTVFPWIQVSHLHHHSLQLLQKCQQSVPTYLKNMEDTVLYHCTPWNNIKTPVDITSWDVRHALHALQLTAWGGCLAIIQLIYYWEHLHVTSTYSSTHHLHLLSNMYTVRGIIRDSSSVTCEGITRKSIRCPKHRMEVLNNNSTIILPVISCRPL